MRVVGSVARDTATAASDLDLLVHLAADAGLAELGALQADLEGLLSCAVDVIPEFTEDGEPTAESSREAALRSRLDVDAVQL